MTENAKMEKVISSSDIAREETQVRDIPQLIEALLVQARQVLITINSPSNKSIERQLLRNELQDFSKTCIIVAEEGTHNTFSPADDSNGVQRQMRRVLRDCEWTLKAVQNADILYTLELQANSYDVEAGSSCLFRFRGRRLERDWKLQSKYEREFSKWTRDFLMASISLRLAVLLRERSHNAGDSKSEEFCVSVDAEVILDFLIRLDNEEAKIQSRGNSKKLPSYTSSNCERNREIQNAEKTASAQETTTATESRLPSSTDLLLLSTLLSSLETDDHPLSDISIEDNDVKTNELLSSVGLTQKTPFAVNAILLLSLFLDLPIPPAPSPPCSRLPSPPPPYYSCASASKNDSEVTLVPPYRQETHKGKESLVCKSLSYVKSILQPTTQPPSVQTAINRGDYLLAYRLVCSGANPNVRNPYGHTLLHVYSKVGDAEKASFLLSNTKICVNMQDRVGKTALHHACQQSAMVANAHVATALLAHGAHVNARDRNGWTPLHLACWKKNLGKEKGKYIQKLIENGADIYDVDNDDRNCIHTACIEGDLSALQVLLRYSPDISTKDSNGCTALHHAAKTRNTELLNAIFDHGRGTDIMIRDNRGRTPLHHAIMDTSTLSDGSLGETIRNLVSRGAQVDDADDQGMTALHYVLKNVVNCGVDFIRRFIEEYQPDMNAKADGGKTPLVIALQERSYKGVDVVRVLLEAGAKVTARAYKAACFEWQMGYDEEVLKLIKSRISTA